MCKAVANSFYWNLYFICKLNKSCLHMSANSCTNYLANRVRSKLPTCEINAKCVWWNCRKQTARRQNDRPDSLVRLLPTRFLPDFRHFASHLVVGGPRVPTSPALRAIRLRLVDGARLLPGQEGFLLINQKSSFIQCKNFAKKISAKFPRNFLGILKLNFDWLLQVRTPTSVSPSHAPHLVHHHHGNHLHHNHHNNLHHNNNNNHHHHHYHHSNQRFCDDMATPIGQATPTAIPLASTAPAAAASAPMFGKLIFFFVFVTWFYKVPPGGLG